MISTAIPNAVLGSIVRLQFQACKPITQPDLSTLSYRTKWWDLQNGCYSKLARPSQSQISPGVEMTKFTIFPLFHPERSGSIYSTLYVSSLPGKQIAVPLLFAIPIAVVGSIVSFPFQTCQVNKQPILSTLSSRTQWQHLQYAFHSKLARQTNIRFSPLCHPERSGGIYNTVAFPNLQGKQIAVPPHFVIPNAVVGSIVRLLFQTCQVNKQPYLPTLSSRTQWWDLQYGCYRKFARQTNSRTSPLCHPERSGGIYSTVAIPNLQGKQIADSLHFVIHNVVVGSIIWLLFQTCQPITQPDLS